MFQSTLPRGERRSNRTGTHRRHNCFNPRSREGSDKKYTQMQTYKEVLFQSTLPRGERHFRGCFLYGRSAVSIHAPARGATLDNLYYLLFVPVSIHAPARGATALLFVLSVCKLLFQSTLPRGERLRHQDVERFLFLFQSTLPRGERRHAVTFLTCSPKVSIHAPARGATVHLNYTIIITLSEHKFADIKKSL